MQIGLILGSAACLLTSGLAAQSAMQISRAVYIERADNSGQNATKAIEPATQLRRGDKVILLVEWASPENGRPFTISSAVPATLAFQRSSRDMYEVSNDGGRNWGMLGEMRTGQGSTRRLVSPEDVTHLRWRIPAAKPGRVTYSALVR